jgi:hemerythrin
MAHISWQDEYSVNVKLIDDQHKQFIALLDEVYDAFSSLQGAMDTRGIIEKLAEHAELHFSTEEKYFEQFHCDDIDEAAHREQHQLFRGKIADLKRRYAEGQTDLVVEMADMMENHIVLHIMGYDKKYVKCFNEHGLL